MTGPYEAARELGGFFSASDPRQEAWWQEWEDNGMEGDENEE